MSKRRGGATIVVLASLLASCGGPERAQDPNGRAQVVRGEALYGRYCAQCHVAEQGIGAKLTRRGLASYRDAAFLQRYNQQYMPYRAEGSLLEQEYWDITAYLLVEYGFAVRSWS